MPFGSRSGTPPGRVIPAHFAGSRAATGLSPIVVGLLPQTEPLVMGGQHGTGFRVAGMVAQYLLGPLHALEGVAVVEHPAGDLALQRGVLRRLGQAGLELVHAVDFRLDPLQLALLLLGLREASQADQDELPAVPQGGIGGPAARWPYPGGRGRRPRRRTAGRAWRAPRGPRRCRDRARAHGRAASRRVPGRRARGHCARPRGDPPGRRARGRGRRRTPAQASAFRWTRTSVSASPSRAVAEFGVAPQRLAVIGDDHPRIGVHPGVGHGPPDVGLGIVRGLPDPPIEDVQGVREVISLHVDPGEGLVELGVGLLGAVERAAEGDPWPGHTARTGHRRARGAGRAGPPTGRASGASLMLPESSSRRPRASATLALR